MGSSSVTSTLKEMRVTVEQFEELKKAPAVQLGPGQELCTRVLNHSRLPKAVYALSR